jgi:hypothetical protein
VEGVIEAEGQLCERRDWLQLLRSRHEAGRQHGNCCGGGRCLLREHQPPLSVQTCAQPARLKKGVMDALQKHVDNVDSSYMTQPATTFREEGSCAQFKTEIRHSARHILLRNKINTRNEPKICDCGPQWMRLTALHCCCGGQQDAQRGFCNLGLPAGTCPEGAHLSQQGSILHARTLEADVFLHKRHSTKASR